LLDHRIFREIGEFLHPGDLLVLNRTRVIPARLFARKPTGGRVEVLLLRREDPLTWDALVGGKGLSRGRTITIENGPVAEVLEELEGSHRRIRFAVPIEPFFPLVGNVPLPPYIHEKLQDPERYQTVYASEPGSAAAPTAGLHFTPRLLGELQTRGINLAYVTLHVGLDTFAPVNEDDPATHVIHSEWCELDHETAVAIRQVRNSGGRVIAVGTTSVRTLESAASEQDQIAAYTGNTRLFITPGFKFKVVDGLLTNFHLPRSTLLMLVSAFAAPGRTDGRDAVLAAYAAAIRERYRFFSYGDAMLVV
jgi:S-adenosylmethionine:tRNA ribosyltransferase-isomerase